MKKINLFGVILFSSLILTGCSYTDSFFIANNSDDVLVVEYKWKDNLSSSQQKFKYEKFDGKSFEKFEYNGSFTKEEIDAAEDKNEIRVTLEPKQALKIHSVLNTSSEEIEKQVDELFRINYLSLKGKKGSIEMTGEQAWFQFRKMDKGYFIVYK